MLNSSTPIQVENGAPETGSATKKHTTPTTMTTGSTTWLVSIFGDRMLNAPPSTWTPPSGATDRVDTRASGNGTPVSLAINTQGPVTAGAKSHTATGTASSASAGLEIIAIQP